MTTSAPIRLFLVDDESLIRAGMRSLLAADARFDVVGDTGDARQAVERISELRPDVVLLDISMPGLSGIDAIPLMRAVHPQVRIVMLTHHAGTSFVDQALKAGANGYVAKDSDPAELALAVEATHRGDTYLSPRVTGAMLQRAQAGAPDGLRVTQRLAALTPREREVFQLLALGKSSKQVAATLVLSVATARKHRENLQRKLGCHSAAELTLLAVREGLLE